MCGLISELFCSIGYISVIIAVNAVCLFFNAVLITMALRHFLKSGSVMTPTVIFAEDEDIFVLAIQGLFYFHINFGIIFLFCEKCHLNF